MQKISIDAAMPGMVIARSVFSADGQLLLAEGKELTFGYIRRLMDVGVAAVYIANPFAPDIEVPEVIREETRVKAIQNVRTVLTDMRNRRSVDVTSCKKIVKVIIGEILSNPQAMVHLTDIRTHDDYTFGHSVNVCLLSLLTGRVMGYNEHRLQELGLGALLHDVGKMSVPLEILNKPGALTPEEWETMRSHSDQGFDILRNKDIGVPLLAAHVAFQHHEKFNGKGYPRGLRGNEIQEYARITAIADVYDALTSARPYRKAMLPHDAYELLMSENDNHFDSRYLRHFLANIAVYPVGAMVRLTTGEIGVVIQVTPGLPTRPSVRILLDSNGRPVQDGREADLTRELTLFVQSVLTDAEVVALCHR